MAGAGITPGAAATVAVATAAAATAAADAAELEIMFHGARDFIPRPSFRFRESTASVFSKLWKAVGFL